MELIKQLTDSMKMVYLVIVRYEGRTTGARILHPPRVNIWEVAYETAISISIFNLYDLGDV